ncbi:hypothetical protein CLV62_13312 [Dysgonomonas alginatilytica]|uniref:Uncharacterized protein n=1 Tax=Dysgonomonas alginatilytica TaxID=1605892 RepID=A0A2V3PQW7_9BACT|nr:hypothetical protein [Dysgonomonas alginatilytica]PXV59986.1 hypothetical protein CLV62_13312 [Dysgonomonas alginatilytica]
MKIKTLSMFILSCFSFILLNVSCDNDNEQDTQMLNLSTTKVTAKVNEEFSVDITLSRKESFQKIIVEKSISGKKVETYHKTLNVAEMQFPYTFKEEVVPEDEKGVVVYSFYGVGADGARLDASDVIVSVNITQLYRLQKYDWKLASQIIQKEEYAEAYMKDDVYRFNEDWSWELDWGTTLSTSALETLDSYCGWKMIGTDEKIDSIYMIKYNIFSPSNAVVTKYKVIRLQDEELVLESRQDLSFLPGFSNQEPIQETYIAEPKSADFKPYRGSDPNSYKVEACKPGTY